MVEKLSPRKLETVVLNGEKIEKWDALHAGEKYGHLKIVFRSKTLQHNQRVYLVKCACGNFSTATKSALNKGDNISCGCKRGLNRTKKLRRGQRFNMLTVIQRAPRPETTNKSGHYYLFKCDCGETKVLARYEVVSNQRKSCGCMARS